MRIRIRIYADKEPELYALYKACGPALTRKIFKSSICAYIDGKALDVDIPVIDTPDARAVVQRNPMFDISIPSEYEKALQNIPDRQTSMFVKTLVRYYTFWPMTQAFGVPHKEAVIVPQTQNSEEKQDTKIQLKEKVNTSKVIPITQDVQPPKPETELAPKKPEAEPVPDIMQLENSDINSLAALFGSIKMG